MFRRVVASLMLVGFAAGQWAAMPHVHAVPVSADHYEQPHLHLAGHGHSHSHSHRDATHTHSHPPADQGDGGPEESDGSWASASAAHDADAVYLTSSTSELSNRGRAVTADIACDWLTTSRIMPVVVLNPQAVVPLDETTTGFAVCLEMRALRI